MSDLIDREEALTALRDTLKSGGKSKGLRPVTFEMIWAIKSLPSAESKKGKWLPHPGYRDWDVCSACGIGCKRREYGLMPYGAKEWMTEYSYQYCPNCGAEMEAEE